MSGALAAEHPGGKIAKKRIDGRGNAVKGGFIAGGPLLEGGSDQRVQASYCSPLP